jgi:hypothetical protein
MLDQKNASSRPALRPRELAERFLAALPTDPAAAVMITELQHALPGATLATLANVAELLEASGQVRSHTPFVGPDPLTPRWWRVS